MLANGCFDWDLCLQLLFCVQKCEMFCYLWLGD